MKFNHGFTLIELIVVVAIMSLTFGIGITAYVTYNNRQILVNAGNQTILMMRTAQKKARVGDRPSGCLQLLSYEVSIANDLATVTLNAVCNNNGTTTRYAVDTFVAPSGVQYSAAGAMQFVVLQGGVTNAGTILLHSNSQKFTFTVDQGGGISQGTVAAYP